MTGVGIAVTTAKVLVADDNEAKRYLLVRWLSRAGFQVLEASNGEATLALALERPDLVVLDVKLPDMTGFEVCGRLKSNPATAHIPVLHLSAHKSTLDDRITGLEGGADAFLTYPVEPEELIATARALLRVRSAEAALRESEERFRLVGCATRDVIWDWDLRTNILVWNEAAETLFKLPSNEILGTSEWWYSRIHPADRARVVAGLHAVIDGAGEYWYDEYRMRRSDDSYATVFDRGYVVHSDTGEPVRMVGSMLDVSERRHSEDARRFLGDASTMLAASLDYEATLKNVARLTIPRIADRCIVYMVDDGGLIRPLEVAASMREEEERLWELQHRYPINPDSGTDTVARVIRGGAAEIVSGSPAPHDDDLEPRLNKLTTSSMVVPLRARGRTLGALVLTSTSPSRLYEREHLLIAQELADRAALAVDNAKLYEAAVLASRTKSDFLGVMSHELRTPLNAILGYSDLLLLGIAGTISEDSHGYIDRVRACAKHLLQLIEQILVFSRMETGKEPLMRESVALHPLISEVMALVQPVATEKGLAINISTDSPDVTVQSDRTKVNQILMILLTNAIKFTHTGDIRLDVRAEAERVVVDVTDSGIGIATEDIEKIFTPFWQVQQEKTRAFGGTGLGLTVARRLAQLLHGDLNVTSRPKRGSTFTLWLPYEIPTTIEPPGLEA